MFGHSERALQEETYNPPVGYYDLDQNLKTKGLEFNKQLSRDCSPVQKEKIQKKILPRVCLASPQLSAYAKPSQRVMLEKKNREKRSIQKDQQEQQQPMIFQQNDRKGGANVRGKLRKSTNMRHTQVDSIEEVEIKDGLAGESLFVESQNVSKCTTQQRKRRRPFNIRNIFSLFPNDSLELAQIREKMKSKPVPPPGYYYHQELQTSMRTGSASKYQGFQSTVRRFSEDRSFEGPSVGQYNIQLAPRVIGGMEIGKYQCRKEYIPTTPGVGSYDLCVRKRAYTQQVDYPSPFGCSSRRF